MGSRPSPTPSQFYSKGDQGLAKTGRRICWSPASESDRTASCCRSCATGTAFYYVRNVLSGHPGSITTVHADSASLAFEQLTLLVKESEGGRELDRDDIRNLLRLSIDVIVQCKRVDGRFWVTEIYFNSRSGSPAVAA